MDKFLIETVVGDCVYLGTDTKPLLMLKEYTGTDSNASVTISSTVEIILEGAFQNKTMSSFTLPVGVKKIKKDAFKGATIGTLNYSSGSSAITTWCGIEFENYYANPLSATTSRQITEFGTTLNINTATVNAYTFVNYNADIVKFGTSVRYVKTDAFLNSSITSTVIMSNVSNWLYITFSTPTSNPIYYSKNLYVSSVGTSVSSISINTSIKDYAFVNLASLTTVTIQSTTFIGPFIGHSAFQGCTNLQYNTETNENDVVVAKYLGTTDKILMSVDAQNLGNYKLTNTYFAINMDLDVNVPGYLDAAKTILARYNGELENSTIYILNNAFTGSDITNITIPDSVVYIGENAFKNCTSLSSEITISNNVLRIGDRAFENSGITKITFYARQLKKIPPYMCACCQNLTEMEIISGSVIDTIGKQAFAYCAKLEKVILPYNPSMVTTLLERIEDQAFLQCYSLGKDFSYPLVIASSVNYIGSQAFFDCNQLKKIELYSNNTVVIKPDSFACCFGIIEIYAPNITNNLLLGSPSWGYLGYYAAEIITNSADKDTNQLHTTEDGFIIYGKEVNGELDLSTASVVGYEGEATSIIIPEAKRIKPYCFYNNKDLISVTLQNDNDYLKTIGVGAFEKCEKLHFTEENGLLYLSTANNPYFILMSYNTQYTDTLSSVILNTNTKFIYQGALYGLNNITSIISNTTSDRILQSADLDSTDYHPSFGNIFGKDYYGSLDQISLSKLLFYSSNSEIYSSTYYIPKSLKTVQIRYDQAISNGAFKGCNEITSITLPTTLEALGAEAFDGCTGLSSIALSNTIADIRMAAFNNIAAELAWGDAPTITTLKAYALQNYQGTELVIPNSVTKITQCALYGCNKLIKLYIPFVGYQKNYSGGGVLLGNDFGPYQYDDAELTRQCTISWSTSSISWSESTSSYYIPSSLREVYVTSNGAVYNGAFSSCKNLTTIYLNPNVPSVGIGAFDYCASLQSLTVPYIGETKTSTTLNRRVAFGSMFSQSSFTGSYQATQYYTGASGYTAKAYYLPSSLTDVTVTGGTLIHTFENCTSIKNITTSNITYIAYGVFNSCINLKNLILNVASTCTNFNNIYSSNKGLITSCRRLENLVIPFIGDRKNRGPTRDVYTVLGGIYSTETDSGLTRITQYCGYQSSSQTSFILLNPYVSSGLTKVIVTQDVLVPFGGFSGFTQIAEVELNEGITEIEERGFYGCSGLTTINIPSTVTSIRKDAFTNTTSLTTINYDGTMADWGSIALHSTWKDGSALTTIHCTDGDITL